jgi:hypothetical protein
MDLRDLDMMGRCIEPSQSWNQRGPRVDINVIHSAPLPMQK